MTKKELRKIYQEKRLQLTEEELLQKNNAVLKLFAQLDLLYIKVVHIYFPIEEKKEIDTHAIISFIQKYFPKIQLVVPKSNFTSFTMTHFLVNEKLVLKKNVYGIKEPVLGDEVNVEKIDFVIVPLLAFDKHGYRVGYGKGFYDRFLKECRTDVKIIGLSLFDPIEKIEDIDSFDVRMHKCITPNQIYTFE